mmetsp:Transcript_127552/g.231945  ORF Transcript_127552/g.231945 Transcript_127552/m.231945 type:complete len:812 (+) Transcript_127552:85-2520(+)
MRAIAIVLACLALSGHGRRVQRPSFSDTTDSGEALAKVLFSFNPAAGWSTMGAAPQHGASEPRTRSRGPAQVMLNKPTHHANLAKEQAFRTLRGGSRQGSTVMQEAANTETFEFQAEVAKVMDIIINSLYSDKDIFLRELVSNAADACDKKRFLSVADPTLGGFSGKVRIKADKEKKELIIEDNGIGMTRKELQNNLGRIAQSGTKKFVEALGDKGADETSLIGQFGVGFYSAFLVADKVTVVSKSKDGPQLRWESESANKYSIAEDDSEAIEETGTRIILTLKEDAEKYLDDFQLRGMLKKYSEFIPFPLELWAEKTEYDQVPDPDAKVEEGKPPKTKTVPRTSNVWEKVNVAEPLWMRRSQDVKKEEYTEFYKTAFKQYDEPMSQSHFALEGQVQFKALLFIPGSVPWELTQDMFNENIRPMKLYVKRVFISDKFSQDLLPRWLTFLKGIVDSDDLPLNVSRELLQKSRILTIIRKRLVRKALDMIQGMKKNEEKWAKFTDNFGKYIKVGLIEDKDNKDSLLEIAGFTTSTNDKPTTLPEYVERMKEGQKKIYYVSGSSKSAVASSPVLEGLRKKGYEIIYALDQIDEIALQGVGKFKEFDVVDAAKDEGEDEADISEEAKNATAANKESLKETTKFIKDTLGKKVQEVIVSSRLTTSPSALTQPKWGMSPTMQKFMKAQAVAQGMDDPRMENMAANLEINPEHKVVQKLKTMVGEDSTKADGAAKQYANLLYDVAAVSSGYEIEDTGSFAKRVVALMGSGDEGLRSLSTETPAPETAAPKTPEPEPAAAGAAAAPEKEEDKPIDPEVL